MTYPTVLPIISGTIEEPWQLSEIRDQLRRIRDDLADLQAMLQGLVGQTTWDTRSRAIGAFCTRLGEHADHTGGAVNVVDAELTRFGGW